MTPRPFFAFLNRLKSPFPRDLTRRQLVTALGTGTALAVLSRCATATDGLRFDDGSRDVLFAGEATSVNHPALVDGAWESGIREAKRLLQVPDVDLG